MIARVAVPAVPHRRAGRDQRDGGDGVLRECHAVRRRGRFDQESPAAGRVPGERDGRGGDGQGDGPAQVCVAGAVHPGGDGHGDCGPCGELGYERVDGGRGRRCEKEGCGP